MHQFSNHTNGKINPSSGATQDFCLLVLPLSFLDICILSKCKDSWTGSEVCTNYAHLFPLIGLEKVPKYVGDLVCFL